MLKVKMKRKAFFSKMYLVGILIVLLIILSSGSGASYNLKRRVNTQVLADFNQVVEKPVSLDFTPHGPIDIRSDSDFIGFPGSGTEGNPYIIEGYSIITTALIGIWIRDTSSFFIIRNCYVEADNSGILIFSAAEETATIINNTCTNTLFGITVQYSSGVTLTNNTCTNNLNGIYLISSSCSCLVTNNLIQENEHYGIRISKNSNDNIIQNNVFIDNLGGSSQAVDDGKRNKWYDAEKKAGNYWSDLGTKCTYKIDGKAHSKDLYPLNRSSDCPNPTVISIISTVIPLLCSVLILAFVVPKYAIPFTRKTIVRMSNIYNSMSKKDKTILLTDYIFFLITLIISIIDYIFANFSPEVFIILLIIQTVLWPINVIIGIVAIVKTTKGNRGRIVAILNMIISIGFIIADGILIHFVIEVLG